MTLFWAAEPSSTILIKDGNQSTSNMATYSTGFVGIDGHKNEVKMAVTLLSFVPTHPGRGFLETLCDHRILWCCCVWGGDGAKRECESRMSRKPLTTTMLSVS